MDERSSRRASLSTSQGVCVRVCRQTRRMDRRGRGLHPVDAPPWGPFSRLLPAGPAQWRRAAPTNCCYTHTHTQGTPRAPPPCHHSDRSPNGGLRRGPRGASYYQTGPRGRRAPLPRLPSSLQPSAAQSFICHCRRCAIDQPGPHLISGADQRVAARRHCLCVSKCSRARWEEEDLNFPIST